MEIRNSMSYTIDINNNLKVSAWIIVVLIAKNINPLFTILDFSMEQRDKASLLLRLNYFQTNCIYLFSLIIKTPFHLSKSIKSTLRRLLLFEVYKFYRMDIYEQKQIIKAAIATKYFFLQEERIDNKRKIEEKKRKQQRAYKRKIFSEYLTSICRFTIKIYHCVIFCERCQLLNA